MRTAEWTEQISVLDRVAAVLDAFGEDDDGIGISELARRANLPKSTVSRIAAELVGQRLLDRQGAKLYLGFRLFEYGQSVEQPRRLRQLALPVMHDLRDLTGHTTALAVLAGPEVVLIAVARGPAVPGWAGRVGAHLPAHATALGKSMLAFSAPEVVDTVTGSVLAPSTRSTIREPDALLRELAETRRTGISREREESALGWASIASPILGPGSAPLAAIAVMAPTEELAADRCTHVVRAAASTVSRRLGAPVAKH